MSEPTNKCLDLTQSISAGLSTLRKSSPDLRRVLEGLVGQDGLIALSRPKAIGGREVP